MHSPCRSAVGLFVIKTVGGGVGGGVGSFVGGGVSPTTVGFGVVGGGAAAGAAVGGDVGTFSQQSSASGQKHLKALKN